jgi:hypothetical protein
MAILQIILKYFTSDHLSMKKPIKTKLELFSFQQQQRPDLSRLMQLQAAGAGLPGSMGGLPPALAAAAGIPPGLNFINILREAL